MTDHECEKMVAGVLIAIASTHHLMQHLLDNIHEFPKLDDDHREMLQVRTGFAMHEIDNLRIDIQYLQGDNQL